MAWILKESQINSRKENKMLSVTREVITFKQLKSMVEQLENCGATMEYGGNGENFVTYAITPRGKKIFKAVINEDGDIYASWFEGLFDKK